MNDNADVPIPSIVLRTEHLSRRVNGRFIVDDVSFEVSQGDILAVVGPSGAGKFSLLRLRLPEPTLSRGREYGDFAPGELRRRVGMVMQSAYLFSGSVADNLRFGPRQRGENVSDAVVSDLVAEVGLPGFASRSVDNLSGGEAQRVSLARALANSPVVLLADEPTSALDEDAKRGIERLIVNIVRQHGLTCIIVTHDTAQAGRVATRVLVMDTGKLKRIGPTQEVLSAEHT